MPPGIFVGLAGGHEPCFGLFLGDLSSRYGRAKLSADRLKIFVFVPAVAVVAPGFVKEIPVAVGRAVVLG